MAASTLHSLDFHDSIKTFSLQTVKEALSREKSAINQLDTKVSNDILW